MKKILLSILTIFILTACGKETTYSLDFSEDKVESDYTLIYEFSDGRKVYSQFSNIEFKQNNKNISLSKALDKKSITIDEIISKMTYVTTANDGGSTLYKSSDNQLSETNFLLISCHTILGNRDIIIGNSEKIIEKC